MAFLTVLSAVQHLPSGTPVQWAAFAYLGLVSMFLGFFAWYHGLAIGPLAHVSQVQLVQPVPCICWAGVLLGEHLTWSTILGGLASSSAPAPRSGSGWALRPRASRPGATVRICPWSSVRMSERRWSLSW
jgi:hypothetical protein